jgi:hypothetical protein
VEAVGGSGTGLRLAARLDDAGRLSRIDVVCPGMGYTSGPGGLPTVVVDGTYALAPATVGTPVLMTPVNPDGRYPLPEFTTAQLAQLNNSPSMFGPDTIHPSPRGVSYLAGRLAQNIYDAVMAL